jgi:hypothetical protein
VGGPPLAIGQKGDAVLLAGPSCRLTDDVREFLWCVAGEGLPLTRRSELHLADLRRVHAQLPGGGPLGGDQVLLAVARRRAALLQALGDAGQLLEARDGRLRLTPDGWEFLSLPERAQTGFVFAAWWEGVDWGRYSPRAGLGRLLRHERDVLLAELAAMPIGSRVDLRGFARRFRALVGHRWPTVLSVAGPEVWRREVWATALAPLAMLGAIDAPGELTAEPPPWFSTTTASTDLLAAAASISQPHAAATLAVALGN